MVFVLLIVVVSIQFVLTPPVAIQDLFVKMVDARYPLITSCLAVIIQCVYPVPNAIIPYVEIIPQVQVLALQVQVRAQDRGPVRAQVPIQVQVPVIVHVLRQILVHVIKVPKRGPDQETPELLDG